jgi:hypothetical protein
MQFIKRREKSYLVLRFLSYLNLVIEFLILRIWSLDFAQILNKSLCHFFFLKINSLSYFMCVSIDKSASISVLNINAILLSAKLSIEKGKKERRRTPNSINKNHLLRHLNLLDLYH